MSKPSRPSTVKKSASKKSANKNAAGQNSTRKKSAKQSETEQEQTPLQHNIEEPISTAPADVQMILRAVIRAEKDNLHLKKTRVKSDILKIIKTAIQ